MIKFIGIAYLIATIVGLLWWLTSITNADEASWYSVTSCMKESGQCIMANGRRLKDEEYTCASWDYPLGTTLRITNVGNEKVVQVVVTDRGPNRRLYKSGRTVDLSKAAFNAIADCNEGIIAIKKEVVK